MAGKTARRNGIPNSQLENDLSSRIIIPMVLQNKLTRSTMLTIHYQFEYFCGNAVSVIQIETWQTTYVSLIRNKWDQFDSNTFSYDINEAFFIVYRVKNSLRKETKFLLLCTEVTLLIQRQQPTALCTQNKWVCDLSLPWPIMATSMWLRLHPLNIFQPRYPWFEPNIPSFLCLSQAHISSVFFIHFHSHFIQVIKP